MKREDAISFCNALNGVQPFVPPYMFASLASSKTASDLTAIANGQMTVTLEAPADPQPVA